MKKFLTILIIIIVALLITFFTFEQMSWYHFGDFPTKVVLIRLIIFFIIVLTILLGIAFLIHKFKK